MHPSYPPRSRATTTLAGAVPVALPAMSPTIDFEERSQMLTFEYARFLNQHSTEYIRMADAKAAVLITLLSANLLVLVQRAGVAIDQMRNPGEVFLIICACIYATVSLTVVINIIRPRVFRNASVGHIFWEDITGREKSDYAESFRTLTVGEIYRELGEHNHNLARSALRKFRWLRIGFYMALTSICCSAAIILVTS